MVKTRWHQGAVLEKIVPPENRGAKGAEWDVEWGGDIPLHSRLGGGERRELAQRDPRIRILGPHITAVGMSLCTNPPNFIQIGPLTAEK